MKRMFCLMLSAAILVSAAACGREPAGQNSELDVQPDVTTSGTETMTEAESTQERETETMMESQEDLEMKMNIQVGDHVLTATLVNNSSTEALLELLSEGPVTISMSDYASMEKVGPFPKSLPRNDELINTVAGDLILYQGNSFVIYYDTNSWNLTRLGKVDNVTQDELKEILGSGDITAVLSLASE